MREEEYRVLGVKNKKGAVAQRPLFMGMKEKGAHGYPCAPLKGRMD